MNKNRIFLLVLVIFLLTGCGNTLKCNIETNNYSSKIKIGFNDNRPITYKYKDKMFFSGEISDAQNYYHSKYTEFNSLISEKYAKIRNNFDKVTLRINYDFLKDNSEKEDKLLVDENDTKKDAIKKIESLGYKCK